MLCILATNNGSGDITISMDCFGQENSEKLLMLHFHLLIQVKVKFIHYAIPVQLEKNTQCKNIPQQCHC